MTADPRDEMKPGSALLLVDVQNDFCPDGALPVPDGDKVVPVLNKWVAAAQDAGIGIYASRDWHPVNHVSFESQGGPWPVHCVQDTPGAAFHRDLMLPQEVVVVTKGTRFDQDQYSAFDQTGFAEELRRRNVTGLWIGGLAEDVCVRASALDARKLGFDVCVILDGTRAITDASKRESEAELKEAGCKLV